MATNKQGKIQNMLNYRMRIILNDGRQMTGQMLAFDKHMNLVLADCEEFRRVRKKAAAKPGGLATGLASTAATESEEKRTLGLAIVRGTNIVSLSVDGPPPADPSSRLGVSGGVGGPGAGVMAAGPGISKPAGRGLPIGLTGPAAGVGGPGPSGFGGFGAPPAGGPPGFGRGGPPGFPPPGGFPGAGAGAGGAPPGFQPPGFQPPGGRGFPPPGNFGGR